MEEMNALGLPGVHVALEPAVRCGVTGSPCFRSLFTGRRRRA